MLYFIRAACVVLAIGAGSYFGFAVRVGESEAGAAHGAVDRTGESGVCAEEVVRDVCTCDKNQCSECKGRKKWGYGCDMECPAECSEGCDLSGNCYREDLCPHGKESKAQCKRNSRNKANSKDICVNARNECMACIRGFHGVMCDKECPENCADSSEGPCTRGGACYECKKGLYGKDCSEKCPSGCTKGCLQLETETKPGLILPAGSCSDAPCKKNLWGVACDQECPVKCGKLKDRSSCHQVYGTCQSCETNWWDTKCEKNCGENCAGQKCIMTSGDCSEGCNPGYWGAGCAKECPEHTVRKQGCDRENGLPYQCEKGWFPKLNPGLPTKSGLPTNGAGACEQCNEHCKGNTCEQTGKCPQGCEKGYYGDSCQLTCADSCPTTSGCHQDTGNCEACGAGFTGPKCQSRCHKTCASCVQFTTGVFGSGSPATDKGYCVSCPVAVPSEFKGSSDKIGTCECISGASEVKGECQCDAPKDKNREAHFDQRSRKCSYTCKGSLRPVLAKSDGRSDCIENSLLMGMIVKFGSATIEELKEAKGTGGCEETKIPVPVAPNKDETTCVYYEFVLYGLGREAEWNE